MQETTRPSTTVGAGRNEAGLDNFQLRIEPRGAEI